ncbi:MAG: ribbon-helix-helix domain-containing protein [Nanoarchaeota archaeon]|nr:ribbon-helix-helix domain-containing protein [Nanoarchaeota archaeon]MBU1321142.1 ribbon-helix-helix domain-containing protein [Nanoarchaeota archaeon]MBU1597896.1 ribbon-helix-helix domain-containing protein [Nanoarchaeota archaeon]MBU2441611.1 ribbon-helix-helix domain-containing protein [Nanoarchaeota archaeon]
MESVTVKFQENVLKKIDESIAFNNFNSRTEFIREAVRDKLSELTRDELIEKFLALRGKAKIKTRPEDDRKRKLEASKEFFAELDKRFNRSSRV